jgi:hypothetical protein
MAVPADPKRHRRQQRRRALIGWLGGLAIVAFFVVAAILGGDGRREPEPIPAHEAGLLDYHMTSAEYDGLRAGENEATVLDRLGKIGLPESETQIGFIQLFPAHDEAVVCSYWEISDAEYIVARLCFTRGDGVLLHKLRRDLSGKIGGESGVRA